ncbi:MAG: hypothetical protein R3C03_11165 [Pirellulaceae bacterium]
MKRYWLFSLGLLAASAWTSTATAIQDWCQPSTYGNGCSSYTNPNYFNPAPSYAPAAPTMQSAPQSYPSGDMGFSNQVAPPMNPSVNHEPNGGYYSAPQYSAPAYGSSGGCDTGPGYGGGYGAYGNNGGYVANGGGCGGFATGPGNSGYANGSSGYANGSYANGPYAMGGYDSSYGYNCNAGPAAYGQGYSLGRNYTAPKTRNLVGGVGGLVFFRDYEDDLGLSANPGGQYLFSTDASNNGMGGVEGFLQSRGCGGRGWEARYWGIYGTEARESIAGMPFSAMPNLSQITHGPTGLWANQIFNRADEHIATRTNRFHNVEINRLINSGTINGLSSNVVNYELLHGARWFEFDEDFGICAHSATWSPMRLDYNVQADNTLLGYQVGGRSTRCLTNRLQLTSGLKFGLYNNRIRHRQTILDGNYVIATVNTGPSAGRDMDYWSSKNELATLSEVDLGLAYMFSNSCRLQFGYRAFGVTGLALAPNQIPYRFDDSAEIQRIKSNSSMILHGFYGGLNFCF